MGLWDLGDGAPLIIDFREQNTVTTGPFVDGDGLKMLTVPIINTINECRTGTNISVSLSSIAMLAGTVVRDFQVLLPNNTLLVVPASNGTGSFMYVINGAVDQIRQFRVYATDTLGNRSGVAVKDVKIVANKKPIIDSLIHNIPSTIKVGRSVVCRLNGAYDPEGDALTYSLTLPPLFTSTKTEDILPNENFTLKVDLSHAVNVTVPILVAVEDTYGDTDDTLINVTVLPNNPPDINTLVTSFPHNSSVYYGNSFTFSFNSIYDADGDVVLIDITNSSGLTFNKTSNISIGEMITASITGTGTLSMTVQAKDNYGGVSNTRGYTVYSSVYVPPPPPPTPPYVPPGNPPTPPGNVNWESVWFSGNLVLDGAYLMTHGGILYEVLPNSGTQRGIIGYIDKYWRIGKASSELKSEIGPIGHELSAFGRYEGPFIDLYSKEIKLGNNKKMFLLAPEYRHVTVNTLEAINNSGIISPWYRQYLNT